MLTISVDDTQVLQGAGSLPTSVLPAFTGATTDLQSVNSATMLSTLSQI